MKLVKIVFMCVAIVVMSVAMPIFASGNFQSPKQIVDVVNNPIISTVSDANAKASSEAEASSLSRSSTEQTQTSTATNQGNSQSTHFSQPRNNPNLPSVFMNPTAVCAGIIHGAGSGGGIGISVGGSYQVENCEINETAKTWLTSGNLEMFEEVLCKDKHSQSTTRCMKLELARAEEKAELSRQLAAFGKIVKADQAIQNAKKREESKDVKKPFDASDW